MRKMLSPNIEIFRLDKDCFLIFLPSKGVNSFLRIGNSKALTPILNRRVRLILLSEIVPFDYQLELESSKKIVREHPEFVALPKVMKNFHHRLEKMANKHIDLYAIPVKTGKMAHEHQGKLRVLFYKDKNVTIISDEEELFSLKKELEKPFSPLTIEERDYLYLLAEIAGLVDPENIEWNLRQIVKMEPGERNKILEEEWAKVRKKESALQSIDELVLTELEGAGKRLEHYALEFNSNSVQYNSMTFETDTILTIGKDIEIAIRSPQENKLSLSGSIVEGKVILSNQTYQYDVIFHTNGDDTAQKIDVIKSFRFCKLLERLF